MEISLNEMRIFARHGVMPDERTLGAWFRVDVIADVDCQEAIDNDDLGATLNYAEVAEVVRDEMEVPSKLIEHVCGQCRMSLLLPFADRHRQQGASARMRRVRECERAPNAVARRSNTSSVGCRST